MAQDRSTPRPSRLEVGAWTARLTKYVQDVVGAPNAQDRELIAQQFDARFYLRAYEDVATSGVDPLTHYMRGGWKSGYDPCPWFSAVTYLELNPDVAKARAEPFAHYLRHGRSEGRVVFPSRSSALQDPAPRSRSHAEHAGISPEELARQRQIVTADFDADFYRAKYSDLRGLSDADCIDHYNQHGWREGRDPSPGFSTKYYLERYGDIRNGGINPFYHYVAHGKAEQRLPTRYLDHKRLSSDRPTVSAIVPNYNHARFLAQRIESIVDQSYPILELIVLDDASTDDSRATIEALTEDLDVEVKLVFNDKNAGNPFRQWEKGISLARGDLIWICESDDFCALDFLENLAPYFVDPSVMIAFGAIQFANREGSYQPGMDGYRESAASGYWKQPRVASAYHWFRGPFGLRNVLANVGGGLFRRQTIEPEVWKEAQSYGVCGDWYLYLVWARGGRIAFDPHAVAYFRQHGSNTSVASFKRASFYVEHFRIADELRKYYGVSDDLTCKFYGHVRDHYLRNFDDAKTVPLSQHFPLQTLIDQERTKRHILIAILGFSTGGGEIFPINLANALVARGYTVSMLTLTGQNANPAVRARLDSRIAVYERMLVDEMGHHTFFKEVNADVMHTHFFGVDLYIHHVAGEMNVPYVVTHHGSYECMEISDETIQSLKRAVKQWVYIADKNLEPFKKSPIDRKLLNKLPNAMPPDDAPFAFTRQDLGIEPDAFVFGLASRALTAKGWQVAAKALAVVRKVADRPVHLLLCGDGPDLEALRKQYDTAPGVKFLGFQSGIASFYKLCDCALLPTRFPGESYPLTLIEAVMVDRPVIATEIGEVPSIIDHGEDKAGIVVPCSEDDDKFVGSVAAAMSVMLDRSRYDGFVKSIARIKPTFDFGALVTRYEDVYRRAAGWDKDR